MRSLFSNTGVPSLTGLWITPGRDKALDEDVVFINIANDKQLVDVADEFAIPIGNAAITDRAKLELLLRLIQSSADYQYVLLDVFFEEGYQTDADRRRAIY